MGAPEEIKAKIDIVDFVMEYIPELKRSGRNFHAPCPFHNERTPSFVVFPERQTWRCFGACATGGDVFEFFMKKEGLNFFDALTRLADKTGIQLETRSTSNEIPPLYVLNRVAQKFFTDSFIADRGSHARAYAEERHLSAEAIANFGIGYSPSSGEELWKHLKALDYPEELILKSGLVHVSDQGAVRDMFHGRLMFPLRDIRGNILGFSGRSLDGSNPKYINTPKTEVFDKGQLLYGLDRAKDSISLEGTAVVVEGYMDVITAHEYGNFNVVASMGTALTEQQIILLRAKAKKIILALDADTAGQEAMLRSLNASWKLVGDLVGLNSSRSNVRNRPSDLSVLRIALVTSGKDPDELIRTDISKWHRILANAVSAIDFLIETQAKKLDLSSAQGKSELVEQTLPLIFSVQDWNEQDRYLQKLSNETGIARGQLQMIAGNLSRKQHSYSSQNRYKAKSKEAPKVDSVFTAATQDPLEQRALILILQNEDLWGNRVELKVEYLGDAANRAILSALHTGSTIEEAHGQLDEQFKERWEQLLLKELPPSDKKLRDEDWMACLRRLEERYLRGLKSLEGAALEQEGSETPESSAYIENVSKQALATNERLRELFVSNSN